MTSRARTEFPGALAVRAAVTRGRARLKTLSGVVPELPPAALGWVLVPLIILVITWAELSLEPGPGIDQSWVISLYMIADQGLHYGTQAVFTYGPLGFLTVPTAVVPHLTQWAIAYELVIRAAVACVVFAGSRRLFGSLAGFLLAVVLIDVSQSLTQTGELVLLLCFALWVVHADLAPRRRAAVCAAGGAYAGFEALVKLSFGPEFLLVVLVVAAVSADRRPAMVGAALVGFISSILIFWLAAGQSLATLANYASNGMQATLGYGGAMQASAPGSGWTYTPALLLLVFGVWAGWTTTGGASRRERWGTVLVWFIVWFAAWKEGFVRLDAGHAMYFFVALMLGILGFRWRREHRSVVLAALATLMTSVLALQALPLTQNLRVANSVSSFGQQVADIVDGGPLDSARDKGVTAVRAADPLNATTLRLVQGRTTSVYPIEQALGWAWRLDWVPFPVFQSYAAYTSRLDSVNARFLASPRAPQRIIYQGTPGVDGRVGAFDEAQTLRAMFCRYQMIYHTATYAVLARGRQRCVGAPKPLGTVTARWGQAVPVPTPRPGGWMVFVRISGATPHGLDSLVSLVYRAPLRSVSLNGAAYARLIPGTATDGLVLRMSAGTDYPNPLNIEQGTTTIAVGKGADGGGGGGLPLSYAFYAQRVIGSPTAPLH